MSCVQVLECSKDLGKECCAAVELADVPRLPDLFHPDVPANGIVTMTGVVLERS